MAPSHQRSLRHGNQLCHTNCMNSSASADWRHWQTTCIQNHSMASWQKCPPDFLQVGSRNSRRNNRNRGDLCMWPLLTSTWPSLLKAELHRLVFWDWHFMKSFVFLYYIFSSTPGSPCMPDQMVHLSSWLVFVQNPKSSSEICSLQILLHATHI